MSRCAASSRRNPTSRNTLPVDTVTLSGFATLTSPRAPELPVPGQRPIPLPSELHIALRCFPAPFLEGTQNVYGLCELRDVQDSVLERCVDADLPNARSDRAHRFPVRRGESLLHTPKLKPSESSGVTREGANVGP